MITSREGEHYIIELPEAMSIMLKQQKIVWMVLNYQLMNFTSVQAKLSNPKPTSPA